MFAKLKAYFLPDASAEPAGAEYDRQFANFQFVLDAEHEAIVGRRAALGRPRPPWPKIDPAKKGGAQRPMYESTGVSLSGGGIRSAAFCLGALQSLALAPVPEGGVLFDRVDYLSTVSGGGYIGSGVSAAMSVAPPGAARSQKFPFADMGRFDDNPALGHLRDYSNYILPRGHKSLGDAVAVVLRGLAANFVIMLAFVFLLAGITTFAYPDTDSLTTGSFVPRLIMALPGLHDNSTVGRIFGDYPFALTIRLLAVLAVYMACWSLWRSRQRGKGSDVRGRAIVLGRALVLAVLFVALLDLQPLAILGLLWMKAHGLGYFMKAISAVAAPFAGIVAFFSSRLAGFLKTASRKPDTGALIARIASQGVILLAAAILPLLLWLFYLWVCAVGLRDAQFAFPHTLQRLMDGLAAWTGASRAMVYLALGAVLLLLTKIFTPNANSLHQLYRDKLSKAFLFKPGVRFTQNAPEADDQDLVPLDGIQLADIAADTGGPYHLINATVNLQGSAQANRRGRDASFFLFSAKFTGSDVTGYVHTQDIHDQHIDLAAAMAISGAAISSDMGASPVAPLAPTLALLNLRLGYWMDNPLYILPSPMPHPLPSDPKKSRPGFISRLFNGYLFSEMFGWLNELSPRIYLTDGGHIENLGLYQLLKRHCSVIVVVDGEADPQMSFHALAIAERYARIDLGVRIDIPWQDIARVANAATKRAQKGKLIPPVGGPHCAVGHILYPGGERGILLYVKASLTGDEPDYVVDYKMRNPVFPHESTGDQFFTEEQFEVYRALGFHALDGFLDGSRIFTCSNDVAASAALALQSVPQYVRSKFSP